MTRCMKHTWAPSLWFKRDGAYANSFRRRRKNPNLLSLQVNFYHFFLSIHYNNPFGLSYWGLNRGNPKNRTFTTLYDNVTGLQAYLYFLELGGIRNMFSRSLAAHFQEYLQRAFRNPHKDFARCQKIFGCPFSEILKFLQWLFGVSTTCFQKMKAS